MTAGGQRWWLARRDAARLHAADWLERRDRGLTPAEERELAAWLEADPRHAEAARQIEASWRRMQAPWSAGRGTQLAQRVAERVGRRRRRARTLVALAALGLLLAGAGVVRHAGGARGETGSVALKPERQVLPDGSRVELNAAAEIEVRFSSAERRVILRRGEALFSVARDAVRPFVVSAGGVAVRAVGTEFSVRMDPAAVGVLVTEGRVAVQRVEAAAPPSADGAALGPTLVEAGRRTRVPVAPEPAPLEVRSVAPEEIDEALAWRQLRVEFTATPLADIVARFNRRNHLQLALDSPALGEIRISGIFWLDDPEGFSRLVEQSAGLRPRRTAPDRLVFSEP